MSTTWNNFSVGPDDEGPQPITEELPACGSCRKRKLRCSRDHPACSHCARLTIPCVYEPRHKPGLKTGAVEALTRRVALLEQILLEDTVTGKVRPQFETGAPFSEQVSKEYLSPIRQQQSQVEENNAAVEVPFVANNEDDEACQEVSNKCSPRAILRKRKLDSKYSSLSLFDLEFTDIAEFLPSQTLLLKLVDHFCVTFHHWIPYLHKKRLRINVCNPARNPDLDLVLHALVALALSHLDRNLLFMDKDEIHNQTRLSRCIVEKFALRNVSVGSLQALIMMVFDHLNNGQPRKAWPLIGSLARTVDYLGLTVEPTIEPSASQFGSLVTPLSLAHPTEDWTELEERRRLFWVIFLLDRFCSVSAGFNTSLTSEDVHRRLPADGGYFTREEPVTTPFFGIWNKSSARIGKSLAHVPAQYNEEDPILEQSHGTSPHSMGTSIDSSKLGAFAYCIEATESLSQVTTFFLQQRINWNDKEHAVNWLTRFKELDLRLVRWKIFLPPRWQDSDISSNTAIVDMDPNLTLAHITHNTSMILLHHTIAYPPKEWNNFVALPKECSAETCTLASLEISNIVDKFLTHRVVFVNVQFAFCTFIAAKSLLFEHQSTKTALRPEFETLVRSLLEMSRRWRPERSKEINVTPAPGIDQAAIFAQYLKYLLDACQANEQYHFNFYDHSCQASQQGDNEKVKVASTSTQPPSIYHRDTQWPAVIGQKRSDGLRPTLPEPGDQLSPKSPSLANMLYRSPSTASYQVHPQPLKETMSSFTKESREMAGIDQSHPSFSVSNGYPTQATTMQSIQDQSLLNLSDTFMDSQFLGMDRVITFDDANFFLPGDAFRYQ